MDHDADLYLAQLVDMGYPIEAAAAAISQTNHTGGVSYLPAPSGWSIPPSTNLVKTSDRWPLVIAGRKDHAAVAS